LIVNYLTVIRKKFSEYLRTRSRKTGGTEYGAWSSEHREYTKQSLCRSRVRHFWRVYPTSGGYSGLIRSSFAFFVRSEAPLWTQRLKNHFKIGVIYSGSTTKTSTPCFLTNFTVLIYIMRGWIEVALLYKRQSHRHTICIISAIIQHYERIAQGNFICSSG